MALDDLIAKLEAEARFEADALIASARAEAAALTTAADERIARRRAEVGTARDSRREAAVERGLSVTRQEIRRVLLDARHGLVDLVFGAVRTRFPAMLAWSTYRARLPLWFAQALECLGDRPAKVACHPALAADLARLAQPHPRLTLVGDSAVGPGFRVVAEDGAMEVDCTLEGRLRAQHPTLAVEVLERHRRTS